MIHNSLMLFGVVGNDPIISYNKESGLSKAILSITVISNKERSVGVENKILLSSPLVITQNKEMVERIKNLQKYDVVQIKGNLVTKAYSKVSTCRICGRKNLVQGVLSFVNPIYLRTISTNNTKEKALKQVKENYEISNVATIIGTVCQDPYFTKDENGSCTTRYQLAIDRKYRIKEDSPLLKTDYPWVKSKGEMAEMDKICLHKSTSVFIDGIIQSRQFKRRNICEFEDCKEEYYWTDQALEIIPYQTEYLNNFTTPEEKEKQEREELKNILKD